MRTAVRVRITGKVQGVWFRAWTCEQARVLGLDGWVRNLSDGSVEALFAGPPEVVERALAACHRGPPSARVALVTPTPVSPEEIAGGSGFAQRPDA